MTLENHVFPEDPGINSKLTNDWTDAAQFSQLGYPPQGLPFVISGLTLSIDYTGPEFDLSEGVAKILQSKNQTQDHSNDTPSRAQLTLNNLVYVVQVKSRTNISLTDNDTNHVFLQIDQTQDDKVDVVTNTTGSTPSDPAMKRAVIDTTANTSRITNDGFRKTLDLSLSADTPKTITHGLSYDYVNPTFYDGNGEIFDPYVQRKNPDQIEVEYPSSVNSGKVIFGQ